MLGAGVLTPWLGLLGDDWWFFLQLEDGNFPEAQLYENPARPGVAYLWLLFWRLFELRLWAYYLPNVLLQWSGALLVFLILRRILLLNLGLAAVAAALALLYPADTTHVYLSTITTRMAGLIALAGRMLCLHVMTRPAESRLMLALSLFLMLLSLLTYETFLFLFAVLPLMLYLARPPTERNWVFRWTPIYSILLGYLAFRLGTAFIVTRARETYSAALQPEPEGFFTQLQSGFNGTSWKEWLYALKCILDWSPMGSLVPFILAPILLLAELVWLSRTGGDSPIDRSHDVALIGIGAVLSFAAVAPVIVSNFTLKNAVGTLDGRLLQGAAIGHGLVVVGLVTLISSAAPTRSLQIAARNTIFAALFAVALVGGVGVQRMYAKAWSARLSIVDALRIQAPSLRDETVLAMLNVPSSLFISASTIPLLSWWALLRPTDPARTSLPARFSSRRTDHGFWIAESLRIG